MIKFGLIPWRGEVSRNGISGEGAREDYSAAELRSLAAATKNANQSRRLLSLAAVLDGMDRKQAARINGMDRQSLRDWVHRFNEHGPDELPDPKVPSRASRSVAIRCPSPQASGPRY